MRSSIFKLTKKYFYLGSILFCFSYVLSSFFIAPYKDEIQIPTYLHDVIQIMFPDDFTCYYKKDEDCNSSNQADYRPFNKTVIFFHEVSCERVLTLRKICSIEAASKYHEKTQIVLLHTIPIEDMSNFIKVLKILNLSNVELSRINIEKYSINTPFQKVCRKMLNRIKSYKVVNEIVKMLTLYKFGGTVIDSDLIVTDSVLDLGTNWVTKEEDNALGLGILAFNKSELSRKILGNVLTKMKISNYNSEVSFRELLSAEFLNICDVKTSKTPGWCQGFKVYGQELFYPINRTSKDLYFQPGLLPKTVKGYRLWDNGERRKSLHADSLLVKIAITHCPRVYKNFILDFVNSH